MSMFTLVISCLSTSNLPWFMDLTFQVPMQYCSLQHQTLLLSPVPSTTGYCFCFGSIPSFFLELFLHWSPVAYWAPTDLGSSSLSILSFAFWYCSWGSQGKNTEVVCHSLLQWTPFCQTTLPWPSHLGSPHMAWLNFLELDKAVVCVIRLASCVWLWFQSSALWYPLSVLTVLLEFLLSWTWGISSQLLQQRTATVPYLGSGVAPLCYHPWPWMCITGSCNRAEARPRGATLRSRSKVAAERSYQLDKFNFNIAAAAESLQLHPALCDPILILNIILIYKELIFVFTNYFHSLFKYQKVISLFG